MTTPRLMGAEVKRKEDPRLITGRASYVTDVVLPGMHHVAFVRSPHAHARITKIDASAAAKRPGVFKVVTGQEIRALCAPLPLEGASAEGSGAHGDNIGRKHYPLSVDRVRHAGEAVAAVIATSEALAVDAAAEVVVHWEPLPTVTDPFAAMAPGAPQLYDDAPGNVEHRNQIQAGETDAAFARAKRVVKQRMVSQRLCGVPLEPRATVAAPDPTTSGIVVWATAHIGAYAVFTFSPDLTLMMGIGVYKIQNIDLQSTCVFTNTTTVAAYRGAGRPEAAYYLERLIDVVALDLGKAPEEVRRRNFIPPSAFPYKAPTGQNYDSGEYDGALTKALELARYADLRREQRGRIAGGDRHMLGVGMSCYVEMCGFGPFESAVVRAEPGGMVTAITGTSAHGPGHETTFAQIIADQLGVDFDKIVVRHGDTLNTPMGNGTGGSRSLAVGGSAILQAALRVQDKARRIAAHLHEAAPVDIAYTDGRYQVKGVPDRPLGVAETAARAYSGELPPDIDAGLEATEFFRPPQLVYPFGAHVAVIELDSETGRVRVRDFVSVDDCGVRINPLIVAGQVHGGLAQGIAHALLEELVYGEDGQLVTGTLMDYAVPRADDLPSFTTDQTVTPTPHNPMGAKGIGEAATIGSTPAIVNAVVDALRRFGVRHLNMPLRPERTWQAIRRRAGD